MTFEERHNQILKEVVNMENSEEYKEFKKELKKAKEDDEKYLNSINPEELAEAKAKFNKIVIDSENPFEDFVQNNIDYYEGLDDSNDVPEDNI